MKQAEYYDLVKRYLYYSCKDYDEVLEEGRKIKKAVEEAMHHAASDKWYGVEKGDY